MDSYRDVLDDLVAGGIPPADICVVHNLVHEGATGRSGPPTMASRCCGFSGNPGYAGGKNAGMRHQLERGGGVDVAHHPRRPVRGPARWPRCERAAAARPATARSGPCSGCANSERAVLARRAPEPARGLFHARSGLLQPARARRGSPTPMWVDGSTIMVRAEALAAVGLYDESLYGYREDAELCLRLEHAGWKVGVVADAGRGGRDGPRQARPGAVVLPDDPQQHALPAAWCLAPPASWTGSGTTPARRSTTSA